MPFTTYGITYFWQNANYIRFDPFFDPGLYDQIRSDPVWSGCSIYKWIRPFRTFFNLITFLNFNFIKVAYRLGQTWTNCKYICVPRNWAKMQANFRTSYLIVPRTLPERKSRLIFKWFDTSKNMVLKCQSMLILKDHKEFRI